VIQATKGSSVIFKHISTTLVGVMILLKDPQPRDERGLSQSAETAIIIAGAVAIATVVVALISSYVRTKLAEI
jgi:hypothetical protein